MEYTNPTFWFGSSSADRSFGLWFVSAIAGLLLTYWLICLVWDWLGRPDRLMKRQLGRERRLDRERLETIEYACYRLDRLEQQFNRQFGEYRTGEEKRETAN